MREQLTDNFYRDEFACPCCGEDTVDYALVRLLQDDVRDFFDAAVTITSGFRCKQYNASPSVGGSPESQHLRGRAADFTVEGIPAALVQERLEDIGVPGLGIYDGWTHLDTRSGAKARWRG